MALDHHLRGQSLLRGDVDLHFPDFRAESTDIEISAGYRDSSRRAAN